MVGPARRVARAAYRQAIDRLRISLAHKIDPEFDLRKYDLHTSYFAPPQPIEVDVAPEVLALLFERTRDQWARLGEADPHWSVLSQDEFRRDRLDTEAEAEFYATGRETAGLLEIFEGRTHSRLRGAICLELGCGVGRITPFLADRFEQVIGADVSPANLEVCRARLASEGIRNVELVQLRGLEDLAALPPFDVFFSVIVLQHNSPPVQKAMLQAILPKIRPGGGALFQAATNHLEYRFDLERYLASENGGMEMHALPQHVILGALRDHGLTIQEVAMDSWTGRYGSNTFFATR